MTSCRLKVALLKQNDETMAFLTDYCVVKMCFKMLLCPSAGVLVSDPSWQLSLVCPKFPADRSC